MGGFKFTTFVMYVILLITFLSLINMIFGLHRFAFYGEFLILLVLFLVAMISVMGISSNFRWAWILLKIFFILVFVDMIFIYTITNSQIQNFFILLVTVVVGFFISLFNIKKPKIEEPVEGKKTSEKKVEKTFKPGKYIASKTGVKYHAPKCDWAKRIKKANAVWFDSKEEAKKAGYKKDDCVE